MFVLHHSVVFNALRYRLLSLSLSFGRYLRSFFSSLSLCAPSDQFLWMLLNWNDMPHSWHICFIHLYKLERFIFRISHFVRSSSDECRYGRQCKMHTFSALRQRTPNGTQHGNGAELTSWSLFWKHFPRFVIIQMCNFAVEKAVYRQANGTTPFLSHSRAPFFWRSAISLFFFYSWVYFFVVVKIQYICVLLPLFGVFVHYYVAVSQPTIHIFME